APASMGDSSSGRSKFSVTTNTAPAPLVAATADAPNAPDQQASDTPPSPGQPDQAPMPVNSKPTIIDSVAANTQNPKAAGAELRTRTPTPTPTTSARRYPIRPWQRQAIAPA